MTDVTERAHGGGQRSKEIQTETKSEPQGFRQTNGQTKRNRQATSQTDKLKTQ